MLPPLLSPKDTAVALAPDDMDGGRSEQLRTEEAQQRAIEWDRRVLIVAERLGQWILQEPRHVTENELLAAARGYAGTVILGYDHWQRTHHFDLRRPETPLDPRDPFWIVCGPPGCGKTYAAIRCLRYAIRLGLQVTYYPHATLLRQMKDRYRYFDQPQEGPRPLDLDDPYRVDFLILDDLAAGAKTVLSEHDRAHTEELLLYRYQHLLPTVLVSNLPWTELAAWLGERLEDRFTHGAWAITDVQSKTPSLRQKVPRAESVADLKAESDKGWAWARLEAMKNKKGCHDLADTQPSIDRRHDLYVPPRP